jgi:hypothetical protein
MLAASDDTEDAAVVTRRQLAEMLLPLAEGESGSDALSLALEKKFLAPAADGGSLPEGHVTRQEMATVAMQACGVNYRNASSTMPVCADRDQVSNNYGTNVARALYFGFMELDQEDRFSPERLVTMGEAVTILNRVADFAGL